MNDQDRRIADLEREVRELKSLLQDSQTVKVKKRKHHTSHQQRTYNAIRAAEDRSLLRFLKGLKWSVALLAIGFIPYLLVVAVEYFQRNFGSMLPLTGQL